VAAPDLFTPQADLNTYTLGPGDVISLDIFDVPEFSGVNYEVGIDGAINLPWIGRQVVAGQTLAQATQSLTAAYAPYIRNPLITVNLRSARTLRVNVVGQVKRPGSYIVSPAGTSNVPSVFAEGTAGGGGGGAASQWPTVTQAIQNAGGITQLANLREIEVRRPQSDGSEQRIKVNLWELLANGDIRQDVTLRDRDTIVIPEATALSPEESQLLGAANVAPEAIRVNVVGEVDAPGTILLPPNSTMNQAILAAGGFDQNRARRSSVQLIRLNPDGTATRRQVPVDLASNLSEENNPALRENDTIVVGRSGLTQVTDTLGNILDPVGRVLGAFDIFGIFDDD
jgi:polysaccharide export outer membrane protein